jgi:inhibitor of cysteine peptidase
MFKNFSLIFAALMILGSLAGCSQDPLPEAQPTITGSGVQENQVESPTATEPAENQQMLPLISGQDAVLQLDASADGSTQQLKVDEVMSITLESNPSTGYAWFASSSDPEVVAQLGEARYQEPQSSSSQPLLGTAGTETLFFEAKAVGTASLTLEYKRGWEANVIPEKTITLIVEVE